VGRPLTHQPTKGLIEKNAHVYMQGRSVSTGPGPTNLFVWTVSAFSGPPGPFGSVDRRRAGRRRVHHCNVHLCPDRRAGQRRVHHCNVHVCTDSPDKQIRWPGPGRDGASLHVYMRIFLRTNKRMSGVQGPWRTWLGHFTLCKVSLLGS
jgi:hypothetical protein